MCAYVHACVCVCVSVHACVRACVCAGPVRFLDLLRLLHNQIMSTLVKIRTGMMGLEALPLHVSAKHCYANHMLLHFHCMMAGSNQDEARKQLSLSAVLPVCVSESMKMQF